MNLKRWRWLKQLPAALAAPASEPVEHARLILKMQRGVIMPARLLAVAVVLYHLYNSPWIGEVVDNYRVAFETIQKVFHVCAVFILVVGVAFYVVKRFPPGMVQWLVFAVGLADGFFLGGVTVLTYGFESDFYWVFPVLIIVNAISIPLATPQIVLNLLLCVCFLSAGHVEVSVRPGLSVPSLYNPRRDRPVRLTADDIASPAGVTAWFKAAPPPVGRLLTNALSETSRAMLGTNQQPVSTEDVQAAMANDLNRIFSPSIRYILAQDLDHDPSEVSAGPYVLRVAVLLLLTFCCYGVQVLAARQRRADEEREEYLVRTAQLHSAGRLAAEVAHQLKNPLAIINNVTFSLHKALKGQRPDMAGQVEMIREEIAKADRIITQIMGYAQLSEGRVERIEVVEELNRAVDEVFPAGLPTQIKVQRKFDNEFPPLMMHRRHFAEAIVNLLQNAREALGQRGTIKVIAKCLQDYTVQVTVQDDGPGIPEDKTERVFEAYYTTKPKGTGLGLAVVKHNVELYGGNLKVESALGRGAKFVLQFPAKTLMKPGP